MTHLFFCELLAKRRHSDELDSLSLVRVMAGNLMRVCLMEIIVCSLTLRNDFYMSGICVLDVKAECVWSEESGVALRERLLCDGIF